MTIAIISMIIINYLSDYDILFMVALRYRLQCLSLVRLMVDEGHTIRWAWVQRFLFILIANFMGGAGSTTWSWRVGQLRTCKLSMIAWVLTDGRAPAEH
ncbi:uncharacterized protein BJ212DRAFT_1343090 [Suillus subaureus]|uniref:Uncharacterized protein n=1 Tax=Suillus subaureus TaxID=48587 RepID=A0A9P7EF51_9AGAM|nr:uncharacterized protein BJ212DRAFT_1343090 [Suillus subaureus]KAG1819795.1 hypothetical protein BJ212DRAFT_1343090 [Suillus subaureus]